jgi:hypothetical protein
MIAPDAALGKRRIRSCRCVHGCDILAARNHE